MVGLWRVAVAVALGAVVGVIGYDVWQTRNIDHAWGFALVGALAGLAVGIVALQVGEKDGPPDADAAARAAPGRERVCYGTLAEPHEEAAGVYLDGAWTCPVCGREV